MTDREEAIRAVNAELIKQRGGIWGEPSDTVNIVDAVLSLSDPELDRLRAVEEAAREFVDAQQATEWAWTGWMDAAFDALRAALAAAPEEHRKGEV